MSAVLPSSAASEARAVTPFPLFIAGLSLVQMTAWGATFYLPSVLDRQIGAALGLSREIVFGGITLMLVIGALVAPRAGAYIDRHGARLPMIVGNLLLAGGLALVGASWNATSYLAGWALFGLAVPLAMSVAAFAAVAQAFPERGRAGITTMMLFGGLSSGVFWPLTGWLEAAFGWRVTCLIFAGAHLFVCLPIVLTLRMAAPSRVTHPQGQPAVVGRLGAQDRRAAFWLLVIGSGVSGLVTWGLPLYFVPMFVDVGMSVTLAIFLASIQAYATFAARVLDLAVSARVGGMRLVYGGALLPPLVFALLIVALLFMQVGLAKSLLIGVALALYGFAAGLIAAGRATLPLELFGSEGYATMLGRLSLWLNLMFAASPLLFALIYSRSGMVAVLVVGLALSLAAAIAFGRLDRIVVRRAVRDTGQG